MGDAGYSKRPLHAKLGLKDGMLVAFIAIPKEVESLKNSCDFVVCDDHKSWESVIKNNTAQFDVMIGFTKEKVDLENYLEALQSLIKPDGSIWACWPKKSSKVPTDITEDVVREQALQLDLVDVKVAAINEIWSGLKLMIRKTARARYKDMAK